MSHLGLSMLQSLNLHTSTRRGIYTTMWFKLDITFFTYRNKLLTSNPHITYSVRYTKVRHNLKGCPAICENCDIEEIPVGYEKGNRSLESK